MSTGPRPELLDELLAKDATEGLSPDEAAELDALLAQFPDTDPDGLERAAAALHLAFSGPPEPLPAHLAAKLERTAVAFVPRAAEPARPVRPWAAWSGWAAAAVLAGVLAFVLAPKREPSVAELRDRLRPQATAFVPADKPGPSGEVVWSQARQEGYLEVRGLPALDPAKEQYQLWIVDAGRPDKEPVDGGVFDVRPDGTALVRVRAPIPVRDAAAFAVTREAAGGVVVSKAKHELVLTPKKS